MLTKILITFLISMVPVIELRGAIPYAIGVGLEPWLAFTLSVIGNMIPVPFILLFIRKIFDWMKRYEKLSKIVTKLENRAANKSESVKKYELVGLCILVAIPLPGTGAWTGALVAALMDMRIRRALPTIFLGVVIAGIVVTLVTALGIHALDFLKGSV
ncbi:MAG: small multidrug export protein [Ruminococcaceae bacterium]|nr:small multidrug export protein [Oscillospiraceae bacterium]